MLVIQEINPESFYLSQGSWLAGGPTVHNLGRVFIFLMKKNNCFDNCKAQGNMMSTVPCTPYSMTFSHKYFVIISQKNNNHLKYLF